MRSTTLFALCSALPLIVATSILFLVPEQWKDTAIVEGKYTSNGHSMNMTRATSNPGSAGVCAALDGVWQYDYDRLCETKYQGITTIDFTEPTKDPRPINVTLGTDLYECTMTVAGSTETAAAWFVGWGLDAAVDGMKVVCKKGPVPE